MAQLEIRMVLKNKETLPSILVASELAHLNQERQALELEETDVWFSAVIGIIIWLVIVAGAIVWLVTTR